MFESDDAEGGLFQAGIRGIVYYGNLADCMGKIADGKDYRIVGDHTPVKVFSGLDILAAGGQVGKFKRYNPAVIRWGHENLIPDPAMVIDGMSARERYHAQFERFFHLMAEAYLTLKASGKYAEQQSQYRKAVDSGTDGLDFLEAQFSSWLVDFGTYRDGTSMTPAMAVGFWLRRGMDGTDTELWTGLRKVLVLYDADWYDTLRTKYPQARVTW